VKTIATSMFVVVAFAAIATTSDTQKIANAQTLVNSRSIVVFVVRGGNPKRIRDWNDLARAGLKIITPDPKTSDAGKWNYLAAFAYALKQPGGSNAKALNYVAALLRNAPMLDADAAKAMTKFLGGTGDVLLASDSEARAAIDQAKNRVEIVVPSLSVVNVDELFGGWQRAQLTHFAAGGTFDQVYEPGLAQ
jgi:ABC-type sulfate transport system substrate-binding protein